MTVMETLTYQPRQPENWLYEIKQKGDPKTCYVMVQNAKVRIPLSLARTSLIKSILFPNRAKYSKSECFDRALHKKLAVSEYFCKRHVIGEW